VCVSSAMAPKLQRAQPYMSTEDALGGRGPRPAALKDTPTPGAASVELT
jgi:hypothetical protein